MSLNFAMKVSEIRGSVSYFSIPLSSEILVICLVPVLHVLCESQTPYGYYKENVVHL
jgi:hypothetical protein